MNEQQVARPDENVANGSATAKANRRLVEELRDEIAHNSGVRDEYQDWDRAQELIEALLEHLP